MALKGQQIRHWFQMNVGLRVLTKVYLTDI